MARVLREFFTVDLRGLRAALAARAASNGLTESDVLRSTLALPDVNYLDTRRRIDSSELLPVLTRCLVSF